MLSGFSESHATVLKLQQEQQEAGKWPFLVKL